VYKTGINSLAIQSEDTLPAIFLPVTIIKEGTFYADSYYPMIIQRYPHPDDKKYEKGLVPFYFRQVNGHAISAFPVMAGLLSLPVYLPPVLLGISITWENLTILAHLSASLIMALSGGFCYLLLLKFIDKKRAWWLTLIYLFGTINLALISQALWQHGAVQLFTILSLLFLFSEKQSRRELFLAGLFLGLAILARPTAAILLPYFLVLAVYLANQELLNKPVSIDRLLVVLKPQVMFILGLLPAAAFFLWYNAVYFGSLANQGYAGQVGVNWLTPFPRGFLGLWLSPSKGLLIYSPVLIFSLVGAGRKNFVNFIFLAIALTHTFILGAWKHWYGGYSFGYRMASEIIPFLILLLVPYLKSPAYKKTKHLFFAAAFLSILVELMGLGFFDGIWHGTFDRGFWDQSWLWSIQNSEAVFNVRRLLVKLAL
ncbi:MAG: hypothetical protein ABIH84_02415, partial [bacterium]